MELPYLSRPLTVGRLTMKNRILMPAMHTLYTENGLPTPRFNEFYWRRAEGGTGLVVVGACRFDGKGAVVSTMDLTRDECIAPWRAFTDGMRSRDCPVAVQLYHAGRYMREAAVPDGRGAIAPSAVYTPFTRETARAMTIEELHAVVDAWAEGARRAREAGFDAVEISGSAGYLISQFLSPLKTAAVSRSRSLPPCGGPWATTIPSFCAMGRTRSYPARGQAGSAGRLPSSPRGPASTCST